MANPNGSAKVSQKNLDRTEHELPKHLKEDGEPNIKSLSVALGVEWHTAKRWVERLKEQRGEGASEPAYQMPDFPDEDIPVEEILEYKRKRFQKKKASFEAHTWFPIKIKDKRPIGILWFGDPHIDDDGCNQDLLDRDIALCNMTEGLFGANIGDTTNNWAGRLVKLYAEQESSVKTARRLAEWFMLDSGVTWLIWILGNHDAWGDGSALLSEMAKRHSTHKLICHDWETRFTLKFPNGWAPRIYAAHDFKGHSQWNPMHGPMKMGQMGDDADLYVAGHKHNAGYFFFENAYRQHWQHFLRVRGYKFLDDYARRNQFPEQYEGCGAVTIFDPGRQQISVYMDTEEGADVLRFKRGRRGGPDPRPVPARCAQGAATTAVHHRERARALADRLYRAAQADGLPAGRRDAPQRGAGTRLTVSRQTAGPPRSRRPRR